MNQFLGARTFADCSAKFSRGSVDIYPECNDVKGSAAISNCSAQKIFLYLNHFSSLTSLVIVDVPLHCPGTLRDIERVLSFGLLMGYTF